MAYPWLSLEVVEASIPAMTRQGVSAVARGAQKSKITKIGFIQAYRRAGGRPDSLKNMQARDGESWWERRHNFVARHMAQVEKRGEALFNARGQPSPRHLALIAWAYSPEPGRVNRWLSQQPRRNAAPLEPGRRTRQQMLQDMQSYTWPRAWTPLLLPLEHGHPVVWITRSAMEIAPKAEQIGMIKIVNVLPADEMLPGGGVTVVATKKLIKRIEDVRKARETYRDEFQQTPLFARNRDKNPWADKTRAGSRVQTVLFDRDRWKLQEARDWLKQNEFNGLGVDAKPNNLRFRQEDPSLFVSSSFRTIPFGANTGIQAVVGIPKK